MFRDFLKDLFRENPRMIEKIESGWYCHYCCVYFRTNQLEEHVKEEHMK